MTSTPVQRVPAVAGHQEPSTRQDLAPRSGQPRLPAVDGLRAFAALWVLLFHMHAFSGVELWPGLELLARSGSAGVSLFLVLSGFCLYLPVAAGRSGAFRTRVFFRRRCGRLLPAYYASLVLVLLAHLLTSGRIGLPRLDGGDLAVQTVSHVTLTHQLFPETFYGLNGAYWSLGLEWELYLTLPLLVLAVRRYGLRRAFVAVCLVTAAYRLGLYLVIGQGLLAAEEPLSQVVLPNLFLGRWSEFALGMVVAELHRSGRLPAVGWHLALAVGGAGAASLLLPDHPFKHMLFGVVFAGLLCTVLAGDNAVARVFAWKPLVAVGVMSYSLYLVHQPLVEVFAFFLGGAEGAEPAQVFLGMFLLLPVVLLAAWVLFVSVERRSMGASGHGRLSLPRRSPASPSDPVIPVQQGRTSPVPPGGR